MDALPMTEMKKSLSTSYFTRPSKPPRTRPRSVSPKNMVGVIDTSSFGESRK